MSEVQELLERGLHYYGLGEVKRAAQLWLELLKTSPGHSEATRYLDYLRDQRPEVFAEIEQTGSAFRQPASASRLDWASSVPKAAAAPPPRPLAPAGLAPPVGDPFDLLAPAAKAPSAAPPRNPLLDGALDLVGLNDFEGALDLLNKAERQGVRDARLQPLREQCEAQLLKLYESRLGGLHQVPKAKMASGDLVWLNLDHRAGFLLSLVDGQVTFEELFSLSGMTKLETARLLAQLVRDSVIGA